MFVKQHRVLVRFSFLVLTVIIFVEINSSILFSRQNLTKSSFIRDTIFFPNASFLSRQQIDRTNSIENSFIPFCRLSILNNDSKSFQFQINETFPSFDQIESRFGNLLLAGGRFSPKLCQPPQKIAIIVCYRNRMSHLKLFLNNIHDFLQKQLNDYQIFIVNQHGENQFNRAALFNVGFIEARKLHKFDCFIFHDVDLLPEDLRNLYRCSDRPRHMFVSRLYSFLKFHFQRLTLHRTVFFLVFVDFE